MNQLTICCFMALCGIAASTFDFGGVLGSNAGLEKRQRQKLNGGQKVNNQGLVDGASVQDGIVDNILGGGFGGGLLLENELGLGGRNGLIFGNDILGPVVADELNTGLGLGNKVGGGSGKEIEKGIGSQTASGIGISTGIGSVITNEVGRGLSSGVGRGIGSKIGSGIISSFGGAKIGGGIGKGFGSSVGRGLGSGVDRVGVRGGIGGLGSGIGSGAGRGIIDNEVEKGIGGGAGRGIGGRIAGLGSDVGRVGVGRGIAGLGSGVGRVRVGGGIGGHGSGIGSGVGSGIIGNGVGRGIGGGIGSGIGGGVRRGIGSESGIGIGGGIGLGGGLGGTFDSGNQIQQRTALNDDNILQFGTSDNLFDGSSLDAAAARNKGAAVKLEKSDQKFEKIDFDHGTNRKINFVDQSQVSLKSEKGRKNLLDFGAQAADSKKAAVKNDEVKRGDTQLQKNAVNDFDLLRNTGQQSISSVGSFI